MAHGLLVGPQRASILWRGTSLRTFRKRASGAREQEQFVPPVSSTCTHREVINGGVGCNRAVGYCPSSTRVGGALRRTEKTGNPPRPNTFQSARPGTQSMANYRNSLPNSDKQETRTTDIASPPNSLRAASILSGFRRTGEIK